jgi:antitoxin component YwqK of YwqJK toxin-antitoxin module
MKKIILFVFIPFIMTLCTPKSDNVNVVEKWDNGNPKVTKEYRDKATDSYIFTEHYKDGNSKMTAVYHNGKLDGSCKYFDDDGYLTLEKNFKNGILLSEYAYKFGKLNGPEKIYHYNGQLWTERVLFNGKPWEVVSNFDSTGTAMDKGTLKDGFGTIKLYDKKGNLLEVRNYKDGLQVVK